MKKTFVFLAVFVMVFGFSFLTQISNVFANPAFCDSVDAAPNTADGGCDGSCDTTGGNDTPDSPDCDGFCDRNDEASYGDCDDACDQGDANGSPDCDAVCAAGDDACSTDCDPLGQCAFGQESQLTSQDVRTVTARIINVILTLLGTVATVIILYGGFKWMTAGGNEEGVDEAKKLMAAGVIGLIIVLAAYSIATFVTRNLQEATLE